MCWVPDTRDTGPGRLGAAGGPVNHLAGGRDLEKQQLPVLVKVWMAVFGRAIKMLLNSQMSLSSANFSTVIGFACHLRHCQTEQFFLSNFGYKKMCKKQNAGGTPGRVGAET